MAPLSHSRLIKIKRKTSSKSKERNKDYGSSLKGLFKKASQAVLRVS